MVIVNNLTKIYKLNKKQLTEMKTKDKTKVAVDNISFSANDGQIFGLLGPNGAGKTTTLRIMSTLLKPTDGNITVQGYDTVKQSTDVRKNICFLTNEIKMESYFTPKYLMEFFGGMYNMTKTQIQQREEELFSYFNIAEFENKKIEELSTGMKQKVSIVVSLIHNPQVIIFDEPTNGLDIITARQVTDYLIQLRKEGKLVIISTHIMSLAQKLCDRMAIIIDGKKAIEGDINSILSKTGMNDLEDAFFEIYKSTKEGN